MKYNNVTTAKNFAHGSYGILQIMGSGTITGSGTSGATITINTNIATGGMSLLSGTYKKAAGNTTGVVQINNNGGAVWVGKDAIIENCTIADVGPINAMYYNDSGAGFGMSCYGRKIL